MKVILPYIRLTLLYRLGAVSYLEMHQSNMLVSEMEAFAVRVRLRHAKVYLRLDFWLASPPDRFPLTYFYRVFIMNPFKRWHEIWIIFTVFLKQAIVVDKYRTVQYRRVECLYKAGTGVGAGAPVTTW